MPHRETYNQGGGQYGQLVRTKFYIILIDSYTMPYQQTYNQDGGQYGQSVRTKFYHFNRLQILHHALSADLQPRRWTVWEIGAHQILSFWIFIDSKS